MIVEVFPSKHGFLEHTYAYRFTAKPDGRVFAFGGDGTYSEVLLAFEIGIAYSLTSGKESILVWPHAEAEKADGM